MTSSKKSSDFRNYLAIALVFLMLGAALVAFTTPAMGDSSTKIYGYVREKGSNDPIVNATITISCNENETYTTYTGRDGYYDQQVEGDRNYTVTAEKEGYKSQTKYVYVKDGEEKQVDFYLEKEGGEKTILKGYTKEKDGGDHIPYVDITITKGNYSKTTQSNSDGYYKVELPEGGTYHVRAEKDGYKDYGANVTVREGEENIHHIRMEKEGGSTTKIYGYVKDKDTKDPINDAKVTISYERESYTVYTDRNGYYDQEVEGDRNYSVKAEKDGYKSQTKYVYVEKGNEEQVDFYLEKEGGGKTILKGYTKEKTNGTHIPCVDITVSKENFSKTTQSDRDGFYKFELPEGGQYEIRAKKDGYKDYAANVTVREGEENIHHIRMEKEGGGTTRIHGYVKEKDTKDPINDAKVTITCEDGHNTSYTVYTDRNGYYEKELEHSGNYSVKAEKDGYKSQTKHVYVGEGEEKQVDFYLEKEGGTTTKIYGYVKEKDTKDPINDAKVTISYERESYTTYTNRNGSYDQEVEGDRNYSVKAEKDGYESQTEHVYVDKGEEARVDFYLDKEGGNQTTIYGYVKDKDTEDPINDAEVTITGQECNCSYTVYTDREGYYGQEIDLAGNYTVIAEKDGYKSQTKDVYVKDGEEKRVDFYLEKEGGNRTILNGYTKRQETGKHIPDVEVTISKGNFSKTQYSDDNGWYEFELDEGGGYKILAKKENYDDYLINISIREGEEETHHIRMEGGKKTTLDGYVTDADTGEGINDVYILIYTTGHDDGIETYSGENGYYYWERDYGGNCTLVAEKDGYEYYKDKDSIYLEEEKSHVYNFTMTKEGGRKAWITGYVKDKAANDPLNDAKIRITGHECNCSYTVYTDGNGHYEQKIDLAGNYTVQAEKDGYESQTKDVYVGEGEEKRVNFSLEKEGGKALPDLVVESFLYPETIREGRTVPLIADIKNIGEGDAENISVSFYDNADGMLTVVVDIGTVEIPNLPAGTTHTVEVEWDTTGQLGENLLWVEVDPDNEIEESNEENNELQHAVTVIAEGAKDRYGVEITANTYSINLQGRNYTILTLSVKNTGELRDSYTLSITGNYQGWTATLDSPEMITLDPGKENILVLTLMEDTSANATGKKITVVITVRSVTYPEVQDSVAVEGILQESDDDPIPDLTVPLIAASVGAGALVAFFRRRY